MNRQLTLEDFDPKQAAIVRDEAIEQVDENAAPDWKALALSAVFAVANRQQAFTADEVWKELGESPREPRALGPVMRRAMASGWVEPTAEFRLSDRISRHRAPIRLWRSLL